MPATRLKSFQAIHDFALGKLVWSFIAHCVSSFALFPPRRQVEDLATPYLRGEAELRGAGRDCLEPVRRRVNPKAGSFREDELQGAIAQAAAG